MFSAAAVRKAAILLAGFVTLASPAMAGGVSSPLTLINGWTNGPSGTANASVYAVNGIVHFKGAITTTGEDDQPFVLPAPYRPFARVYVPIDACKASNARLDILTDGTVTVETEEKFDKAKCLISLDGATLSLTSDGFKPLKLQHKWSPPGFGSGSPAINTIDGMVTFQGAMTTRKQNMDPFVIPAKLRPDVTTYVKVDLCNATNGRLEIESSGEVTVQYETIIRNAKCFTSLDGVSYALNANSFVNLDLINGWSSYFSGDRQPGVSLVNGIVHFVGAIRTSDTNPQPFVLPSQYRPPNTVYLPVDMCSATNGRLVIKPDGTTTVESQDFTDAECFTSLEGVSFEK